MRLPRVTTDSTGEVPSSTKLTPIPDVSHQAGPPVLLTDHSHMEGSHDPLLELDNLLEGLTELRTGLDLLLLVYYKLFK